MICDNSNSDNICESSSRCSVPPPFFDISLRRERGEREERERRERRERGERETHKHRTQQIIGNSGMRLVGGGMFGSVCGGGWMVGWLMWKSFDIATRERERAFPTPPSFHGGIGGH